MAPPIDTPVKQPLFSPIQLDMPMEINVEPVIYPDGNKFDSETVLLDEADRYMEWNTGPNFIKFLLTIIYL